MRSTRRSSLSRFSDHHVTDRLGVKDVTLRRLPSAWCRSIGWSWRIIRWIRHRYRRRRWRSRSRAAGASSFALHTSVKNALRLTLIPLRSPRSTSVSAGGREPRPLCFAPTLTAPRYLGMVLIMIFAEVLGLYGMIVGLMLATKSLTGPPVRPSLS